VGKDKEAAKEMIRVSSSRSVPVIVIGKEVIVGFDTALIDAALSR
jgi:alkyl hydroperoxide reductase subunit F